jgi:uncharacterized protein
MHRFRYRAFWLLLDLDELPELSSKLRFLSHNRPNLFSIYDTDHGNGVSLRSQVERRLGEAQVDISDGAIHLLCMPRTLGHCFNPLSIYFCYHKSGALAALVYEVHNTFGEQHRYVIPVERMGAILRQRCRKAFYVSPFMDMDLRYEFRVAVPDDQVSVGISAKSPAGLVISAVLAGTRRDLTDRTLLSAFMTIPMVTLKVIAAIHWEALRLWWKGLRLRRRAAPHAHLPTAMPKRRPGNSG